MAEPALQSGECEAAGAGSAVAAAVRTAARHPGGPCCTLAQMVQVDSSKPARGLPLTAWSACQQPGHAAFAPLPPALPRCQGWVYGSSAKRRGCRRGSKTAGRQARRPGAIAALPCIAAQPP